MCKISGKKFTHRQVHVHQQWESKKKCQDAPSESGLQLQILGGGLVYPARALMKICIQVAEAVNSFWENNFDPSNMFLL